MNYIVGQWLALPPSQWSTWVQPVQDAYVNGLG